MASTALTFSVIINFQLLSEFKIQFYKTKDGMMLILSKRRNIVVGLFSIPPDLVKSTDPHRTEIAIFSRYIGSGRISSLGGSTKSGIDFRGRPSCQWPTVGEVFHNSTQVVFWFMLITRVIMVQL